MKTEPYDERKGIKREEDILLIVIKSGERLESILQDCMAGVPHERLSAESFTPQAMETGTFRNKRILFAVYVDRYGAPESLHFVLRALRMDDKALGGSIAGIILDGEGELYTKAAAQNLALAISQAGGTQPGKAIVEGTGSLYNQQILAEQYGMTWEETYRYRCRLLVEQILSYAHPAKKVSNLLVIHSSERRASSSLWLADRILEKLPEQIRVREIALHNGTVQDCRGCGYEACRFFSENGRCFYGGAISKEVIPAIEECDAMLFLCPNYNDAISANIMALINRMTGLAIQGGLFGKQVFGIIVSGYSGGDLVAKQLFGAMCLNKPAIWPPYACIIETANDPESVKRIPDIQEQMEDFARHIQEALLES